MNTLFLALMLPATVLLGLHDVLTKKILARGPNEQALLVVNFFIIGTISFITSLLVGWPEIEPGFWLAFSGTVLLNIVSQWCWYSAFQSGDVSTVSPIRLLTPPLVLITGFLTLKEVPTAGGVLGVIVTFFGLWLLLKPAAKIRLVSKNDKRAIRLALAGAVLFALSFPLDKKAVITSSALFFVGLAFPLIALGNLIIYRLRKQAWPDFTFVRNIKWLPVYFLIHAGGTMLSTHSLNYALAVYASSVKRLWSFWAVIFSGAILKENIGQKLLATIVMLLGISLMFFI